MRRAASLCEGDYLPATFGHFAPIDLANAVRGNELFMDFYDHPDRLRVLLARCAEAVALLEPRHDPEGPGRADARCDISR